MLNPRRTSHADLNYEYEDVTNDESDDKVVSNRYRKPKKATIKNYTYADVKALLKRTCPNEFRVVVDYGKVTFIQSTGPSDKLPLTPTCNKRLCFGKIMSPNPDLRESIFIYIGSEGNNRIGLTSGKGNAKFILAQASLVRPVKPFWYLNSRERVTEDAEKRRLRALTCFLFLQAGHVSAVQNYPKFEEGLEDAIVWYGKGLEVHLRETSNTMPSQANQQDRRGYASTRIDEQGSKVPHPELAMVPLRQQNTIIEQPNVGLAGQPLSKKRKASDTPTDSTMTQMRRHYKQLGEDIATYELEHASIQRNEGQFTALEQRVSQLDKDCEDLKLKLKAKDIDIESGKIKVADLDGQLRHMLSISARDASRYKEDAAKERLRYEEEQGKRTTVEKRLEEIMEAQNKITAMFSPLKK